MRFPGFGRQERQPIADPAAGQVYVERRPGESAEAFEARLAAAARQREAAYVERRPGESIEAYEARRADLRTPSARRPIATDTRRPAHTARVERPRRRHGFPVLGLLVVLIAAVGALWMVLAAREGSFAAGGAVVDRKLAEVTAPARVATNEAVDRTGAAVQSAGQTLETQGERIRQTAQ